MINYMVFSLKIAGEQLFVDPWPSFVAQVG